MPRAWEILRRTSNTLKGIVVKDGKGKRALKFGTTGAMRVYDEGLARDIAAKYDRRYGGNGELTTIPVDDVQRGGGPKKYKSLFTVPAMPWKHEEADEPRHFKKNRDPFDYPQEAE